MRPFAVAFLLVSAAAFAQSSVKQEREELREKVERQRAAQTLLKNQKGSLLELLERANRVARAQSERAKAVEGEMRAVRRRVELIERQEAVAKQALDFQVARLGPRLTAMDRLSRTRALDALLSAEDFSAMVWRSRALRQVVEGDLRLLQTVQRASRFHQRAEAQLVAVRAALATRLEIAKREAERAAERRMDFAELLELVQAEQNQAGRVLKELELSERELTALIEEMEAPPAASGFGALKGRLPLPTEGRVEVGFGKIVNPKFNTVTVHKGLDLRAPLGTPVRAVAEGRVAFAGELRGYGKLLILDHGDDYHTVLAHLATLDREVGERVQAGEVVGGVGDTGSLKGAYLYFEIRKRGVPTDPSVWLAGGAR